MSAGEDPLRQAIAALRAALLETGAPHMLIGGMAVILRGVARITDDVDATIWAEGLDPDGLLRILARHGIAPRIQDAAAFARERQVLLLRHDPSGTPMELSLAWLPFEQEALRRAEVLAVGGVSVPVAAAQDLVVYKAVAWRERDRSDIERLLRSHRRTSTSLNHRTGARDGELTRDASDGEGSATLPRSSTATVRLRCPLCLDRQEPGNPRATGW